MSVHRISRVALDSHARHVVERDGTGRVVDGSIHGTWAPGAALKALGRALAPVAPSNVPIESITAIMALLPGDVIATGTPAGIGPLLPGDRVTVRVEGIGELTNPVVA